MAGKKGWDTSTPLHRLDRIPQLGKNQETRRRRSAGPTVGRSHPSLYPYNYPFDYTRDEALEYMKNDPKPMDNHINYSKANPKETTSGNLIDNSRVESREVPRDHYFDQPYFAYMDNPKVLGREFFKEAGGNLHIDDVSIIPKDKQKYDSDGKSVYKRTSAKPPAYVLRNIGNVGSGSRPLQIKRMKQLEQEKDVLLQGLEAVERARDWYLTQIRAVQEKQKYVGKSTSHNDYSVEAHQERMNFQHARISEVNQQLKALVESSEKGFPLHMNLALSQRVQHPASENTETSNIVAMLKGQNRLLTQEVSEKSDKISQLEREKAALIRDLFESRSKHRSNNYDDTTFM